MPAAFDRYHADGIGYSSVERLKWAISPAEEAHTFFKCSCASGLGIYVLSMAILCDV